jgi:hypothetical protein
MKSYLIAALMVGAILAIAKPFDPAKHVKATRAEAAISNASSSAEGPRRLILPMQVGGLSVAMAFGR